MPMPTDDNGRTIPTSRVYKSITDDVDGSSDSTDLSSWGKRIIEVVAVTYGIWVKLGATGGSIAARAANAIYIPADTSRVMAMRDGDVELYYIRDSSSGYVNILDLGQLP